ncbi:MAG: NAD(P)H-dependent oxidoreductase [Desulfobulbaceae bacterium]|nr:NAD(P)H-dependent oxidoreductase [Desulfobulbaceae bacterium]
MKCLVVWAHPLENSLCGLLTSQVADKLATMGHEVTVEDLYAEKFEPALTPIERETYYSASYDSSDISGQVDRLREADALVLLFPTWWFGFPAILKGWFDRVWGPGIAYDHADDFGPIQPRLDNLRKCLVVTTLGSPWWVDRLIMRQPLKRVIRFALLGACARKCSLKYFSLYKSEKLAALDINRFMIKIEKELNKW